MIRMLPLTPATFALAALIGCNADTDWPVPHGAAIVEDRALSEMSGLEASPRDPHVLWSINDSGSFARLYRLGLDGRALGRVAVHGAFVRDSETLAVWQEQPGEREWLLIGDVGDNRGWRRHVAIHAVAEPALDQHRAQIAWTLRFRYPDGPRDAEGMAVDHRDRQLLVISKRDRPARLYAVPLDPDPDGAVTTARLIATLPVDEVDGEVTGLDVSTDGRLLAVLSYRGLYVWERAPGIGWDDALAREPRDVLLPSMRKAEAMAFNHDSTALLVGSEKRPTPLVRLPLDGGKNAWSAGGAQ